MLIYNYKMDDVVEMGDCYAITKIKNTRYQKL